MEFGHLKKVEIRGEMKDEIWGNVELRIQDGESESNSILGIFAVMGPKRRYKLQYNSAELVPWLVNPVETKQWYCWWFRNPAPPNMYETL